MTQSSRPLNWRLLLRQFHWMVGAASLIGLLFYACTGFLLNHQNDIHVKPHATHLEAAMDPGLMAQVAGLHDKQRLSQALAEDLTHLSGVRMNGAVAEVSENAIGFDQPMTGGKSHIVVDKSARKLIIDRVSRGPVAFITDLHRGRGMAPAWHLLMDAFAISVALFALSGLGLLLVAAKSRRMTWPLLATGLALPVIIFLIVAHV